MNAFLTKTDCQNARTLAGKEEIMKYSVHLINSRGDGSYLSVKGRMFWGKRTALKHARGIASTKAPVFGAIILEVEDEHGRVVQTFTRQGVTS